MSSRWIFRSTRPPSTINPPFGEVTKVDDSNELATLSLKRGPLPTPAHRRARDERPDADGHRREPGPGGFLGPAHRQPQHPAFHLLVRSTSTWTGTRTTRKFPASPPNSARSSRCRPRRSTIRCCSATGTGPRSIPGRPTRTRRALFPGRSCTEDESLVLKHTDHLSSQYGVDYSQITVGGGDHRADGGAGERDAPALREPSVHRPRLRLSPETPTS